MTLDRAIPSSDKPDETSTSQAQENQFENLKKRREREIRFLRSHSDTNLGTREQTGEGKTRLRRSHSDSHLNSSHPELPASLTPQDEAHQQLEYRSGPWQEYLEMQMRDLDHQIQEQFDQHIEEQLALAQLKLEYEQMKNHQLHEQEQLERKHLDEIKQQKLSQQEKLEHLITTHSWELTDHMYKVRQDQQYQDHQKCEEPDTIHRRHNKEKLNLCQEIIQERMNLNHHHELEQLKLNHEQQNLPPHEQENQLKDLQRRHELMQRYIRETFQDDSFHRMFRQIFHQTLRYMLGQSLNEIIEHLHTCLQERAREEQQKHNVGQLLDIDLSEFPTKTWLQFSHDLLAKYELSYKPDSQSYRYLKDILQVQIAKHVSDDEGCSIPPISDEERKSQAYQDLISELRDEVNNAPRQLKNPESYYREQQDNWLKQDCKYKNQKHDLLRKILHQPIHDLDGQIKIIREFNYSLHARIAQMQNRLKEHNSMIKYFPQQYRPFQEQTKFSLKRYEKIQKQFPLYEAYRLDEHARRLDEYARRLDEYDLFRQKFPQDIELARRNIESERTEVNRQYFDLCQRAFNPLKQLLDKNRDKLNLIGQRLGLDLSRVTWKMFSKASDAFLAEYAQMYGTKNISYKYLVDISQGDTATHLSHDEGPSTPPVSDKERESEAYKNLKSLYRFGCIKYLVEDLLPGIGLSQVQTESCEDLAKYIQEQSKERYGFESDLYKKAVELSQGFTVNLVSDGQTDIETLSIDFHQWKHEWHRKKEGELLDINLSKVTMSIMKNHIHKPILESYNDQYGSESPQYTYAIDISQGGVSNLVQDAERKNEAYQQVLSDFRQRINKLLQDLYSKHQTSTKQGFEQKKLETNQKQPGSARQDEKRKLKSKDIVQQHIQEQRRQIEDAKKKLHEGVTKRMSKPQKPFDERE
jgi:hypothetical protein